MVEINLRCGELQTAIAAGCLIALPDKCQLGHGCTVPSPCGLLRSDSATRLKNATPVLTATPLADGHLHYAGLDGIEKSRNPQRSPRRCPQRQP